MLSCPSESAVFVFKSDCTINDVLDELCHAFTEHASNTFGPQSVQPILEPLPVPKDAEKILEKNKKACTVSIMYKIFLV